MTIEIDEFLKLANLASGLGNSGSSSATMLRGLNIQKGMPAIPHNTDNQGYVFFTRPGLNLTYDNITNVDTLSFMMDDSQYSMANAIRCMLSPDLFNSNNSKPPFQNGSKTLSRSKMIDDKLAFLPISNFLERLSPWPDTVMDVYNSAEGRRGEQVSFMDGYSEYNGTFQLTASFDNMDGDFITAFFGAWLEWGNMTVEGRVMPYPVFLLSNEIDYTTRIWRLIMDRSRTFVQNIAATGYAFPTTNPDGAKFGYDRSNVFNEENNKVDITFQCCGARKNKPILVYKFNETAEMFNPDLISKSNMIKVPSIMADLPFNGKDLFNWHSYPYINVKTMELEWWVYKSYYDTLMSGIKDALVANKSSSTSINTLNANMSASKVGANQPPKLVQVPAPGSNTKPII